MAGSRTPRPLASVAAIVARPVEAVAAYALRVEPGPVAETNAPLPALTGPPRMVLSGGPDRFEGRLHGGDGGAHGNGRGVTVTVDVDRRRRALAVEGQWWYRGEYTLDPDPAGTRLTHTILNLTRVPDGLIKLWQRSLLRRQQGRRRRGRRRAGTRPDLTGPAPPAPLPRPRSPGPARPAPLDRVHPGIWDGCLRSLRFSVLT